MKKYLFLLLLFVVLTAPFAVDAQACQSGEFEGAGKQCGTECVPEGNLCLNLQYPKFGPFDLNENQSLAEMIGFFYYFIVGIAGLAAFIMLIWGGVQWLLSGAIPSQASAARDKLGGAVLGLLLVLASFLIVQILNPELTVISGRGLGLALQPTTCAGTDKDKDGDGKCDVVPPITPRSGQKVVLTANGQEELLSLVGSSHDVTLDWQARDNYENCRAHSEPNENLWRGGKATSGVDVVRVSDPGISTFTLQCSKLSNSFTGTVRVSLSSSPPQDEPTPTVVLEAKDSNAPDSEFSGRSLTFDTVNRTSPENDIPSGTIVFRWTSTNAARCEGSGGINGNGSVMGPNANDERPIGVAGANNGIYEFKVTCLSSSGARFASDAILLTVK